MSERGFAAQLAEDLSPDDLRLVLSVFEADVSRLLAVLSAAAEGADAPGFRRAAHALAGAAGAVGAAALEQICRAAMDAAGSDADDPAATLAGINRMADLARADLADFLARLDQAG